MKLKVFTLEEIKNEIVEKEQKAQVLTDEKRQKLTERQLKFYELILTRPDLSERDMVEMAGYSPNSKTNSSAIKKAISGKLSLSLRDAGVSEFDLARVARDALNATKTLIVKQVKRENGKIMEESTTLVDVPDHAIRLNAFAKLCQLGNYFPAKKVDLTVQDKNPYIGLSDDFLESLKREIEARMNNKIKTGTYEIIEPNGGDDPGTETTLVDKCSLSSEKSLDIPN